MVNVNDIFFLLQVVVVTHAYGDRSGVRYLTNYLKVFSSASSLLCRVHYQILSPCSYYIYCFFVLITGTLCYSYFVLFLFLICFLLLIVSGLLFTLWSFS